MNKTNFTIFNSEKSTSKIPQLRLGKLGHSKLIISFSSRASELESFLIKPAISSDCNKRCYAKLSNTFHHTSLWIKSLITQVNVITVWVAAMKYLYHFRMVFKSYSIPKDAWNIPKIANIPSTRYWNDRIMTCTPRDLLSSLMMSMRLRTILIILSSVSNVSLLLCKCSFTLLKSKVSKHKDYLS